jgi:hypothetical protein
LEASDMEVWEILGVKIRGKREGDNNLNKECLPY